jgi:hypothetical protein
MNDETTKLDQADEEILAYTVSDEALEAAAGENAQSNPTCYQTRILFVPCC